jgi:hypothetical protein
MGAPTPDEVSQTDTGYATVRKWNDFGRVR